MSLRHVAILASLALLTTVGGCSKKPDADTGNAVQNKPLTNPELTEIAAQVERGERSRSDLAKYGITVGAPEAISADKFMRRLVAEQASTQPSTLPTTRPAGK